MTGHIWKGCGETEEHHGRCGKENRDETDFNRVFL